MKPFLKLLLLGLCITFSSQAQSSLQITTATTASCSEGTLTIDIDNGVPPFYYFVGKAGYEYSSGPVESNHLELTALPPGEYFIRVYDQYGFYNSVEKRESIASAFDISYVRVPVTCNNNGAIAVEASGGAAPYSYLWNNGATTSHLDNLASGTYFLTVTDANGCKAATDSLYIEQRSFQVQINNATPYTCHQKGSASVSVSGNGTAPYSYYWQTNPVQTTATADNLMPGDYTVIVTDAQGCTASTSVIIYQGNAFAIQLTETPADCEESNGTLAANPIGGTAPFTYLWSNNATSSFIDQLPGNTSYRVTVRDAAGCESSSSGYVEKKSPLLTTFSTTKTSCQAKDGSVTVNVSNGTAPYTYVWANSSVTGSTLSNIAVGTYYVRITDANGCSSYSSAYISEQANCQSTISGTVFNDLNGNCVQDNGEVGFPYALIKYGNNQWFCADANGHYKLNVYPGNHTLSAQAKYNWFPSNCTEQSITVNVTTGGTTYTGNDLFVVPTSIVSDVSIDLFSGNQRPGETRPVSLMYSNNGTQVEQGVITYTFSEGWNFAYASPMPDAYNASTKTLTWYFESLHPLYTKMIQVFMSVPTSTEMGSELNAEATININNTDENPDNNTASLVPLVTNSYDPNDIQVSPQGNGNEGFISEQLDALTYRIRFQNTGTDVAYNITVKNKIDANLEDYTISILDVSHEMQASIEDDSIRFDFIGINLADSTSNEPESHGYIIYRINKKSDLAPLTQIFNQADIYFDYNAPIETNKVKNTIAAVTTNLPGLESQEELLFYPNPCRDQVQLSLHVKDYGDLSLQLYSASGQQISIIDNQHVDQGLQVITLDLTPFNLPAGLYVAKVIVKDKVYTRSIILNR